MSRLIDADKLIAELQSDKDFFESVGDTPFVFATIGAINDIKKAPTVDAVKVVPCKNCKYWYRYIVDGIEYVNFSRCVRNHGGNGRNFFCADGERKDNEAD